MGSGRDINPALLTKMSSFPKAFVTVEIASKMESWSRISRSKMMIDDIGARFVGARFVFFAASWRFDSIFLGKGSMELRAIYGAPALANE
jgi:hypothetical protein